MLNVNACFRTTPILFIMSDKENPFEDPVATDDESDNPPADLNEDVTPPWSDGELDLTGKQIAIIIMYTPALVLGLLIGRLND